jgi:hypothetical protein
MKRAWTLDALRHTLLGRLPLRRSPAPDVRSASDRSWIIAPEETAWAPSAFYLPGQLERITGQAFNSEPPWEQVKARSKHHGPTRGYLLRNVTLVDGSLYKGDARTFLATRRRWLPRITVDVELESVCLYCSTVGLQYFGSWLIDDCPTYLLAHGAGQPATLDTPRSSHAIGYEQIFAMDPLRLRTAFFRELIVFDDFSQNSHKRVRFRRLVERASATVDGRDCPGVFILRGSHGARRILVNELELAEELRTRSGFRVIDPMRNDVPAILAACKGARTVVGVEGSALMHGLMTLEEGGSVVTLQPPSRFVSVYKNLTDRDSQYFAFVVGKPVGRRGDFVIDSDELQRTLDMLPASERTNHRAPGH